MIEQKHERRAGLSGFQLKIIALVLMAIDHVGEFFQPLGTPLLLRWLGRLSAPLFIYMLAEGYSHTRSLKKYLIKLYLGSTVMGIGNLLLMRFAPRTDGFGIQNNIFGLFFLAVLYMLICDKFAEGVKKHSMKQAFLSLGAAVLPFLCVIPPILVPEGTIRDILRVILPSPFSVEGGLFFLIFSVVIYLLKDKKIRLVIFVLAFSALMFPYGASVEEIFFGNYQWMMALSLPLILAYDGRRGYKKQGFFYIFYPAHVWLLFLVSGMFI